MSTTGEIAELEKRLAELKAKAAKKAKTGRTN
jgi:hypothetical protein